MDRPHFGLSHLTRAKSCPQRSRNQNLTADGLPLQILISRLGTTLAKKTRIIADPGFCIFAFIYLTHGVSPWGICAEGALWGNFLHLEGCVKVCRSLNEEFSVILAGVLNPKLHRGYR